MVEYLNVIRSNPLKLMEIIKIIAIADDIFDGNADATAGAAIF